MSEREETPTERVAHLGRIATLDPGRYVVRLVVDDGHGGKEYERLDRWQARALAEACAQWDRIQASRVKAEATCTANPLGGACWPPNLCQLHECDDTDEGCRCEGPEAEWKPGTKDTKTANEAPRVPAPGRGAEAVVVAARAVVRSGGRPTSSSATALVRASDLDRLRFAVEEVDR